LIYTLPFQQLGKNDMSPTGGKGANLGEMTAAIEDVKWKIY